MMKIAVFASGGGTDFQSVIDGVESGLIKAKIDLLIASKPDIFAIERAKKHGIDSFVFRKKDYESGEKMFEDIISLLKERQIDLIVLAGYLTILAPNIVKEYENRIVNIHPSLLPKFGGVGMYGIKVHEAVIASGEKESGCTVHYVDAGADTGKIIAQAKVTVSQDDTAQSLQQKVLEQEHQLLPKVVAKLIEEMKK
ncbi:MAG: phosphoribosylglycinamide formyltransferase [Clostridia bacterium]|nr:phosphoribosylglycinamide formyltransferase [Clostridia bacterium]